MTEDERRWIERAIDCTSGYGIVRIVVHQGHVSKVEANTTVRPEKGVDRPERRPVDSPQQ